MVISMNSGPLTNKTSTSPKSWDLYMVDDIALLQSNMAIEHINPGIGKIN
jgi:hypothetical protein